MTAALLVGSIAVAGGSGLPALFLPRGSEIGQRTAAALVVLSSLLAIAAVVSGPATLELPWNVPGGAFALELDGVSAMFVLQIAVLAALTAVYGLGYWRAADHPRNARKLQLSFGILTAGMLLLTVSRNGVLFLMGWELMALAAFLAVTTEDEDPSVREAGLLYLVLTHTGTLALFALFTLLAAATGTFAFGAPLGPEVSPGVLDALFVLGLVGFGLKAGMMPLHVWLPSAHASAPSHVSALMSGMLIKTGIYGLVRLTSLVPSPPVGWGLSLLALGVVSAVLGVAFALAQHDLKRLLAWHSIENIGIILMGLGTALLGRSLDRPDLEVLGLASALLHTWNHGLFKALLFLGAGSVVHATGTREIDRLGGLARALPRTSLLFLVGAVAISGLPPLNGFVSEVLLYLGLFRGALAEGGTPGLALLLAIPALALVGALAAACFGKVFGAVFLGTARSGAGAGAHEAPPSMTLPMAGLALACFVLGLAPFAAAPVLDGAVASFRGAPAAPLTALAPLHALGLLALVLTALLVLLGFGLRTRSRRAPVAAAGTWDCGYAAPTPRMQTSASSFAQMLVDLLSPVLRPRVHAPRLAGPFPAASRFESTVGDVVLEEALLPAARAAGRSFGLFRWIQRGSVHLYLLYVASTLVLLLAWSRCQEGTP